MNGKCASCKKITDLSETNIWRPFCSERCQLIDLGEWISGEHRIAGEEMISPVESIDEPPVRH